MPFVGVAADMPEPLLPTGDRPFLDYLLFEAARFGFKRILLLADDRAGQISAYLTEGNIAGRFGVQIDILAEDQSAGTGGALWYARDYLDDSFYLLNGVSWFDFNWLSLMAVEGSGTAVATIGLRHIEDASCYGVVETEGTRVLRFLERPSQSGPGNVTSGVYLISKDIVSHLRPNSSLERDVFPALAQSGLLRACIAPGRLLDIGIPANYEAAQHLISSWQRRAAVFLDRDGTLNEDTGYVHRIADFHWLPGVIESIKRLNDAGFYVFVVTNQAGVARGMYEENDIEILHAWMQDELRARGAHIDAFRYCPFHPEGSVKAYLSSHPWRKPEPGMLLDLMEHWPIDAEHSLMIGDKDLDVEAGHAAGIRAVKVGRGGILPEISALIAGAQKRAY